MSESGQPYDRFGHSAVWTGREMIVWGGYCCEGSTYYNTGGRYNPVLDNWHPISVNAAPTARWGHSAVWTGSRMIVWGGFVKVPPFSYEPTDSGGVYDPVTDTWTSTVNSGAPAARGSHAGLWTGNRLLVWGGCRLVAAAWEHLNTGALYDPDTNQWTPTSTNAAPLGVDYTASVWSGKELLVYGGNAITSGRYEPSTGEWAPIAQVGAPGRRQVHAFTGTQLLAWGGFGHVDGGLYCAPPPPRIEARPAAVAFGRVVVGQATTASVAITNRGGEDLVLAGLTSPVAPFAVTADGCSGQTVPHGVSCTFMTTFAPASTGSFGSGLGVASNDPETPLLTVGLGGQGTNVKLDPTRIALVEAGTNGVAEPGEAVGLVPTWKNVGLLPVFGVTGSLTAAADATIQDATATYGTIAAGATSSCASDCYRLVASGPRPAQHWDVVVSEAVSSGDTVAWTLHIGDSFSDVLPSDYFYPFIEKVFHHGITRGCGGGLFCPGENLPRDQAAALLARALAGGDDLVPAEGGVSGLGPFRCRVDGVSLFSDIEPTDSFCRHVHALAGRGVTLGCDGGRFCPKEEVSRSQMAALLARVLAGDDGSVPASGAIPGKGEYDCHGGGTSVFSDVDAGDHFCRHIHYIASRLVTDGCAPDRYCPNDPVTREQAAKLLSAAFGLTLLQ
ncbi:MAG: S-layer homology domain-containing protein [Thermoanaerobaculaceae bacterium]